MTRYTVRRVDAARRVDVLAADSSPDCPSPWSPPRLPAEQSRRLSAFIAFAGDAKSVVSIIRGR